MNIVTVTCHPVISLISGVTMTNRFFVGGVHPKLPTKTKEGVMPEVKWETVPLHRVGTERQQDHWSWALDLLIVDRVVHWSVENESVANVAGSESKEGAL